MLSHCGKSHITLTAFVFNRIWLKDHIKMGREITSEDVRYQGNDHIKQFPLHVC